MCDADLNDKVSRFNELSLDGMIKAVHRNSELKRSLWQSCISIHGYILYLINICRGFIIKMFSWQVFLLNIKKTASINIESHLMWKFWDHESILITVNDNINVVFFRNLYWKGFLKQVITISSLYDKPDRICWLSECTQICTQRDHWACVIPPMVPIT